MASPFWLSWEAMLSQHCHVDKDDAWPLANSFISQLVRTHEGNRAAMYLLVNKTFNKETKSRALS